MLDMIEEYTRDQCEELDIVILHQPSESAVRPILDSICSTYNVSTTIFFRAIPLSQASRSRRASVSGSAGGRGEYGGGGVSHSRPRSIAHTSAWSSLFASKALARFCSGERHAPYTLARAALGLPREDTS